jgi:hypothetical protein
MHLECCNVTHELQLECTVCIVFSRPVASGAWCCFPRIFDVKLKPPSFGRKMGVVFSFNIHLACVESLGVSGERLWVEMMRSFCPERVSLCE